MRHPGMSGSETYPLLELGDGHGDQLWLPMALQLEEARLVLDDLSKEECKQLFMITRLREVLAEALSTHTTASDPARREGRCTHALQRLLDGHLLRVHEALDRDGNRQVDIVRTHVFAQGHARTRFRHTDHALQMPHRDREGTRRERLAAQIREEPCEFLRVHIVQLRSYPFARVHDVLAQEVLRDQLSVCGS
jgi:hypothetical protein